jgi:TRAP-type mannitol/chloroaromatic compound transport system permease large subunit
MFILIGSTVFSFTFNAAEGHHFVESLFRDMPGGALGFLIVVNLLIFVLGCFIDFFEIAFIVIPLLAPVADKILPALLPAGTPQDVVLIWFGVIVALNLQTSFLTPPFGFALFYLRNVAPRSDYADRISGRRIPAVTTAQIYKGAIAFIIIQLVMVLVVIAYPHLVLGGIEGGSPIDLDRIQIESPTTPGESGTPQDDALRDLRPAPEAPRADVPTKDDDTDAVLRALQDDARKK